MAKISRESDFLQRVRQRCSHDTAYPRPDFMPLMIYLESNGRNASSMYLHRTVSPEDSDVDKDAFAVVCDIGTGSTTCFGSESQDVGMFVNSSPVLKPSIVFLRGYASPEWIDAIGKRLNLGPELFQRHLNFGVFRGFRNFYCSPLLPSASTRVFQLIVPTICTTGKNGRHNEPENLQQEREKIATTMLNYTRDLHANAKVADSMVREFILLNKEDFIIEQLLTIEVGAPKDDWRIVIWLDQGRDLAQSIPGPWCSERNHHSWESLFHPAIVADSDSNSSPFDLPERDSFATPADTSPGWHANQNLCWLPFKYGSRLNRDLAQQDAHSALKEMLHFAASAEGQALNLISAQIERELDFIGMGNDTKRNQVSLVNLKYIKSQLVRHRQYLSNTVTVLQTCHKYEWPYAEAPKDCPRNKNMLDYQYLVRQVEDLIKECEVGMTALANSTILSEAHRSYEMALHLQKLTIIATIFIPMSFISGVWGMNFNELGSGTQPLWKFFASIPPVFFFTIVLYYWRSLVDLYGRVLHTKKIDTH